MCLNCGCGDPKLVTRTATSSSRTSRRPLTARACRRTRRSRTSNPPFRRCGRRQAARPAPGPAATDPTFLISSSREAAGRAGPAASTCSAWDVDEVSPCGPVPRLRTISPAPHGLISTTSLPSSADRARPGSRPRGAPARPAPRQQMAILDETTTGPAGGARTLLRGLWLPVSTGPSKPARSPREPVSGVRMVRGRHRSRRWSPPWRGPRALDASVLTANHHRGSRPAWARVHPTVVGLSRSGSRVFVAGTPVAPLARRPGGRRRRSARPGSRPGRRIWCPAVDGGGPHRVPAVRRRHVAVRPPRRPSLATGREGGQVGLRSKSSLYVGKTMRGVPRLDLDRRHRRLRLVAQGGAGSGLGGATDPGPRYGDGRSGRGTGPSVLRATVTSRPGDIAMSGGPGGSSCLSVACIPYGRPACNA